MIDTAAAASALGILFGSWEPWLVVIPGLIIGLVFGAVPGLQGSMAMAICLPLTLYMDFLPAMLFLTAIFTGAGFGCAVPAVLINIPGTSAAVATCFDGYPMARKGLHSEALGYALGASVAGTAFGYVLLLLLVDSISNLVLRIGPTEMVVVILWGLTLIAVLRGRNVLRGLIAGFAGVLLGTIGLSTAGVLRGTAGITELLDGVPVVPAILGMFAVSELLDMARRRYIVEAKEAPKLSFRRILDGFLGGFSYPAVVLRGSLIGSLIGALPGVGSSVSNLVSYADARRSDRDPESFGRGNPKGVVASEAANSSSEGGSMVTLLALGIPGGGGTAILLAAFSMHNVTGGPRFIAENTDIVYAIILGNFAQAILLALVGLGIIHLLSAVVLVPVRVLVPSVLALSVFGAYGLSGDISGPVTVLVFGVFGWVLKRYDYSVPAAVVGLLLGKLLEAELVHSWQISGGQAEYLLERPITIGLLALLIASVALPPLMQRRRRRTTPEG
ncbi:tripartite tricarboxylate transporter permease [Falsiroseomonas sp.]|uniref:tripartite tricarboxylate transporter permease n=1 Tax=Falsiroseomonas sp. TaxID=2870721 RepID=UPI00356AB67C